MPVLSSTSRETDEYGFVRSEKYVTERGFELSIETTPGGLYHIVPNSGGVAPTICGDFFTSHLKARDALIRYLQEGDRLGFAEYPGKPEELKRKPAARKVKADGPSEE